ncbi:ING family Png2 [Schizosaccharomyces japonicus yFS275]|uniref:Chromatin modification-related protein n=1 Tax=Schizosaccharomyces japonicus (strain yFS275 / FY16936) TaxID=402676 RepID=B6K3P0_SCHJY|nr:ING family Png2 [Schizosaccharomyces japonicus yFS275]EEB08097.1 ING family Png2 [Schizosaccharomyces japonicus yFS275]
MVVNQAEAFTALNVFSKTIVSIPDIVGSYFTSLKEVESEARDTEQEATDFIKELLENESQKKEGTNNWTDDLKDKLQRALPKLTTKVELVSDTLEQLSSCIERMDADFDYVELEFPPHLRFGSTAQPNGSSVSTNARQEGKREGKRENKRGQQSSSDNISTGGGTNQDSSTHNGPSGSTLPVNTPSKRRRGVAASVSRSATPPVSRAGSAAPSERKRGRRGEPKSFKSSTASTGVKPMQEVIDEHNTKDEPLYCYCEQVSYGEMIGCDGENCKREWFHLPCVGLVEPPKGIWYCRDCEKKRSG